MTLFDASPLIITIEQSIFLRRTCLTKSMPFICGILISDTKINGDSPECSIKCKALRASERCELDSDEIQKTVLEHARAVFHHLQIECDCRILAEH